MNNIPFSRSHGPLLFLIPISRSPSHVDTLLVALDLRLEGIYIGGGGQGGGRGYQGKWREGVSGEGQLQSRGGGTLILVSCGLLFCCCFCPVRRYTTHHLDIACSKAIAPHWRCGLGSDLFTTMNYTPSIHVRSRISMGRARVSIERRVCAARARELVRGHVGSCWQCL